MFNVGDKVRVRNYDSIPEDRKASTAGDDPNLWSRQKARACGKTATIVDAYESERYKTRVYKIHVDGKGTPSVCLFLGEDLTAISEDIPNVDIKFEYEKTLVRAKLYVDGELVVEGHGYVFHNDVDGYTQAASYALYMIRQKYSKGEINE